MALEKKTILIVDDEPDFQTYLSTFMEDQVFSTVVADDGVQARAIVKENRPDLITLDITKSEKSGVKFYREMKENEEFSRIPIIIVTGIAKEFQKFISTRKQVPPPEGYFTKPPELDELLDAVNKLTS